MTLAVGYHATHVVNVLIAVVGRVLVGIVLEDPHNPSATITMINARFFFPTTGTLQSRATKVRITDLSWPIVSPELPAQPDVCDCSCSSQPRSSIGVMFTRSLNSLLSLSKKFVYQSWQWKDTQSRCLCPSLFPLMNIGILVRYYE